MGLERVCVLACVHAGMRVCVSNGDIKAKCLLYNDGRKAKSRNDAVLAVDL